MKRTSFALACTLSIASALAGEHPVDLAKLRNSMFLAASFDGTLDAEVAAGDPKLYTATGDRTKATPGLPENVVHAKGTGKFGDAIHFTKKVKPQVFFRGEKNLGYTPNGWSGAASFWLKLDPDKDLEPGYCDPLQFIAQAWDEGNMFVEFSKDHTPRHFRYAIQPVKKSWNPANRGWETIPDKERPMVPVVKPPFTRERWTHVVFCFGNINSGKPDGWGRLYLDGVEQGVFKDWAMPFNWDVTRSALTIGASYVGMFDELAVFNRPLSEAEVKAMFEMKTSLNEFAKQK